MKLALQLSISLVLLVTCGRMMLLGISDLRYSMTLEKKVLGIVVLALSIIPAILMILVWMLP